jgi:hypothetical protein
MRLHWSIFYFSILSYCSFGVQFETTRHFLYCKLVLILSE